SALNLHQTFSWARGELSWYGDSDERFKVVGGNQRIPDGLARALDGQVRLGHALRALAPAGAGYRLSFETAGGMVDVAADAVVLALPFTMLRGVELSIPLDPGKRAAIDGLGYGSNAKLFLGFDRRAWRADGRSGDFFAPDPAQSGWDSTRLQDGEAGALTVFVGGRIGAGLGARPAEERAREMLPALERVFPGSTAAYGGRAAMFDWPRQRFVRASYACYRPGQWTTIRGHEGTPAGDVLFAGEHCSADFQGFMEGAAETGVRAGRSILARLGVRRRAA
ncbi:MAG: flavin monoamine oxidase family protein, partial [Alphaproteobacteria bacterium]